MEHLALNHSQAEDPSNAPFNTSAVDLRLGNEVFVPTKNHPVTIDLRDRGHYWFLHENSNRFSITERQPYTLVPNEFVLATTLERVSFSPRNQDQQCYSARVEGKSSLARCGILVHFTAPTINTGFEGNITLEMINMGVYKFQEYRHVYMPIVIEEVKGSPIAARIDSVVTSRPFRRFLNVDGA